MFKNVSPDLVRSGRTCPANLGVRSCPVKKLICPVRSSPNFTVYAILFELFSIRKSRNDNSSATYQNDGSIYPGDDVKIHGATYGEGILDDIVSHQSTIKEGLSSGVKGGLISESFAILQKMC